MSDVWLRKNRNCFKICRLYSSNTAHAECRNKVILATTRATGAISKSYMTNITGKHGIKILQKAAILGTWHVIVQRYWKSTKRLSLKTALHVPRMVTREYLQHSLFQTYNFKYLYWGDKTNNSDNDDDDDDNDNDNNNNLIFLWWEKTIWPEALHALRSTVNVKNGRSHTSSPHKSCDFMTCTRKSVSAT